MDLTGRPLLDTTPDHELFGGRDGELARLADWVEHGRNVLLIGERGSGKTTLLRQLAYELRQRHPRTPPAFVEGRLVTDARVLLELVRRRLGLRSPPEAAAWPTAVSLDGQASGEAVDLADLVRGLREAGPRRRRVILVDEPPTTAAQTLFGRPAAMLMSELESLGAASAADERLLRRLGWTRPRAVQVLRELEDRGLVTSSSVKGRAGRPRKVYRPSDLIEAAAPGSTGGRDGGGGRP